ncbi:hypothetical protein [Niabella drilacis]|uniref:MG2 domain-containing protein n=1 Tax=Niabella drilacis (strain DSM 25811 / CCM 8410 / CCUG 62505 / LMG 26954 / E90) TaxID=1285928 RepID=A0A1G6PMM0_NIADE|nr:hypothetical protein [Niabella drilacis]SDC81450.1 hypothetical protein SAMN04487894_10497 [Niabella drilacis]
MYTILPTFLRCSRLLMLLIGMYAPQAAMGQLQATEPGSAKEQPGREIIFVHSDKEAYLAGELLWFKVYLLNAGTHIPAGYNSILYIELVNDQGRSVIQSKIQTTRGTGKGSFYLPVNIATGAYTLIAYTNQMKLGDERALFKKRILVSNTIAAANPPARTPQPEPIIRFFPEGGAPVEGSSSKTGVQVLDPHTIKGLPATGYIIENSTDTVARFELLKFGLGQFTYTPLPGRKYTAAVTVPGKGVIKKELPAPRAGGSLLSITDNGNDTYLVKVILQNTGPQKMTLVAHSEQKNKFATTIDLQTRNIAEIPVSKSKLGTGVICFTLFDQHLQPVNERLVFIPGKRPSKAVTISAGKQELTARDRTSIQLASALGGDSLETIQGSLSVYAMDNNNSPAAPDIRAYLQLTAGLSGSIESPEFYFTPEAANGNYIENLMLVNGWRRFDNQAPLFDPALKYLPEYDGHIVAARVFSNWNHQPAPGVSCLLTAPSIPFGLYNGTSDSSGIVRFNIKKYYGPGDIFIKPTPSANAANNYTTAVISPFIDSANRSFTQPRYFPDPADSAYLLKRSIAMQTVNIYYKDKINTYTPPPVTDTLPFYGKPEISYLLDDYKRFSTMEEVLREYVQSINVVMRDRKPHMTIYDEKYQNVYRYAVLVLLDGVPLADYNSIFNYNPYKVKRLDVVPRRYVIGSSLYSGVVSFQTYESKFDGFELDPSAIAIDYEGLQLQRVFYAPVYANGDKGDLRVPDNRTTLLWEPDIQLTGGQPLKLDCFTSDFKGTYKIVLQGISSKGSPVFSEATFMVK